MNDSRSTLKGKVVIITGAGRNIGEEIAKLFASLGAKIAVVDIDKNRANELTTEINNTGGDAISIVADISNSSDVQAMVKAITDAWGKIDILINNAAVTDNKNILDITLEEWERTLAVTLTGPFLVAKHVAEQMVSQGQGGKIINISSTSAHRGRPRAIAYTAAKAGVVALSRNMAVQLAPHNIQVNAVSPNKIGSPVGKDTFNPDRPITNLKGRPGEPRDVAKVILFLVSEDSDFIVGENILIDGGATAMT